tara:strand:- start:149 stop:421 length:273 start_codon:yes stop_codon:yes gene_type:complete
MDLLIPTFLALGAISLAMFFALKWLNKRKSQWGINASALSPKKELHCPNCNTVLPKVRKPANLRQALWGGFTCAGCGKEYDKWLREVHSS